MFTFTDDQRDNLREWADFLQSTDLEQGHESLFDISSAFYDRSLSSDPCTLEEFTGQDEDYIYCCLGIWALIRHPEDICLFKYSNTPISRRILKGGYKIFMPPKYEKELGLKEFSYVFSEDNNINTLEELNQKHFAFMNDKLRWNFKQIATEIYHILEYGEFSDQFTSSRAIYRPGGLKMSS